jgi:hypothetical protein
VVQDIQEVPEHFAVEVLDYDIDKYDESELSEDQNHRACRISQWTAENRSAAVRTNA